MNHGEVLRQKLKEKGIKQSWLAKEMGISKGTLNSILKTASKGGKENERSAIPKYYLCLICSLTGLSPEDLGYSSTYFKSKYSSNSTQEFIGYNSALSNKQNYNSFFDSYFRIMRKYILEEVTESIYLLDYVAREIGVDFKGNKDYYHKENSRYFNDLEQKLSAMAAKNEEFKYTRIAQLPLECSVETFEQGVQKLIEILSLESFQHIWKNFCSNYKAFFSLYLLIKPIRLFSWWIVDEKKILSEYSFYDIRNIPIPNLLFMNTGDKISKDLISCHLTDLNSVISRDKVGENKQVFKEHFSIATNERMKLLNSEVEEMEKVFDELCKANQEAIEADDDYVVQKGMENPNLKAEIISIQTKKISIRRKLLELKHAQGELKEKLRFIKEYQASPKSNSEVSS